MKLRRLTSKPRGLLRDATLLLGLILYTPDVRLMAIGGVLFLLGTALHFWSKGCLVRNWTVTTVGPYGLVRHPFYLANLLIDEGICIISGVVWLPVVYFIGFLFVYLPTIRKEEAYLTEAHGDAYAEFARKVPALLPYRLHALASPSGFALQNLSREGELFRLLRILAIPLYFLLVGAVFHESPADEVARAVVLWGSAGAAVLLNAVSVLLRQRLRAARRMTQEPLQEPGPSNGTTAT